MTLCRMAAPDDQILLQFDAKHAWASYRLFPVPPATLRGFHADEREHVVTIPHAAISPRTFEIVREMGAGSWSASMVYAPRDDDNLSLRMSFSRLHEATFFRLSHP